MTHARTHTRTRTHTRSGVEVGIPLGRGGVSLRNKIDPSDGIGSDALPKKSGAAPRFSANESIGSTVRISCVRLPCDPMPCVVLLYAGHRVLCHQSRGRTPRSAPVGVLDALDALDPIRFESWFALGAGWSFGCFGSDSIRFDSIRVMVQSQFHFISFRFVLFMPPSGDEGAWKPAAFPSRPRSR